MMRTDPKGMKRIEGNQSPARLRGSAKICYAAPMKPNAPAGDDYEIRLCAANDLSGTDLAACIELVTGGDAVNPATVKRDLPCSTRIAIVRKAGSVVGVGVIKPIRPRYAAGVSGKSKIVFDEDMPELGYVAVSRDHQGHGLSARIVGTLLTGTGKPLFATTSNARMKSTLTKAGFVQRGKEWKGRRGDQLSLWLRP